MISTTIVSFSNSAYVDKEIKSWARLEQVYKPVSKDNANMSDLSQMLNLARRGVSAYSYISDVCPYAKVVGSNIIVTLDFYVWLSSLELSYNLKSDIGTISNIVEVVEENRSFDVPFKNSNNESLPYIFNGDLVPEMPFILNNGEIVNDVDIIHDKSNVQLSRPVYCVLRANGIAIGHKHSIEMVLTKSVENEDEEESNTGYKIQNLRNSITLTFKDENGDNQEDIITLDIPPCVEDLLKECPDDNTTVAWTGCFGRNCNDTDPYYVVKVNGCNGHIVSQGWDSNA